MERKHSFRCVVALGILVLGLNRLTPAQYGGGTGTPEYPYQIASAWDLIDLGNTPADYDKHFVLTADIDLSGTTFYRAVIAPHTAQDSASVIFTGVFAGNNHVIRHLQIDGEGYLGLFGYLASSAVVSELGLENASVQGMASVAGGLAGWNEGAVSRCYSTAAVTGVYDVGGLVGVNSGSVSNCYGTAEVAGVHYVGGLVGRNSGHVSNCYSTGEVTSGDVAGGLVGYNSGSVSNCYSTSTAAGNRRGAGLGRHTFGGVGGLAGYNSGSVSNCYSSGAVTGDGDVGGLVADNSGSVVSSFWDRETSGLAGSAAGVGLTTAEMQNIDSYLNAGWDFVGERVNGTAETWQIPPAGGGPELSLFAGYEPVLPAGQGTLAEPFLITNAQELGSVGYRPLACYRLEADIDLAGITWSIAPAPWFAGRFDGNGHVIGHLEIQGGGLLGLFGALGANSVVMDLGLEGVSVQGTHRLGSLAGRSRAVLIDCYSTGAVGGEGEIGVLVGYNSGSVLNCHSTGVADGNGYDVGGLVGSNCNGSVSNCYSSSAVTGHGYHVGGLVGSNYESGSVSNCYSTGVVAGDKDVGGLVGYSGAGVARSFWDIESSGVAHSSGGAGLTTAEMMDPEWIGLQGWASDPNWLLAPHQDYPRLAWEGTEGRMVPEPTIDWMVGQGTRETPYEINDPNQLLAISKASLLWEKSFVLMGDLDLAEIVWAQAVIPGFAGVFDGNGHVIKSLKVSGWNCLGLCGRLEIGGVILNLGLLDVDIAGSGGYVGGLVGENDGSVWNCYSTGAIVGDDYVGGLVGYNDWGGISNCYSTGVVAGDRGVGGLVGTNPGVVRNCYSTGVVTGNDNVGGLVGGFFGAKGVAHSFWNTTTSRRWSSEGGMGLGTAGMQEVNTYLDAGWDFVGEVENGTDDIWWILEGQDYPRLWWEAAGGEF